MQYEIFHDTEGWRWRLVEKDGRVLASAPRILGKNQCLTAVRIMQMSMDAPLLVRAGGIRLVPASVARLDDLQTPAPERLPRLTFSTPELDVTDEPSNHESATSPRHAASSAGQPG